MEWRAWYDDGSVYDSRSSDAFSLPGDGALLFMLWRGGRGRQIMQGTDYYFVAPGDIWGQAMPTDYPPGTPEAVAAGIEARYPGARVIRGREVSRTSYLTKQTACYASGEPT